VHSLLPETKILNILGSSEKEALAESVEIYTGEWLYVSLSHITSLLDKIYFCKKGMDTDITILGKSIVDNIDYRSKSVIRSQIALVDSCHNFPDDVTVEEEIQNYMIVKGRSADLSHHRSMLDKFSISIDQYCTDLSISNKIILDIILAVESDVSLIILNGIVSLLPQPERSAILNYLHHSTVTKAISVIIATENKELKSKFLGRDIL